MITLPLGDGTAGEPALFSVAAATDSGEGLLVIYASVILSKGGPQPQSTVLESSALSLR